MNDLKRTKGFIYIAGLYIIAAAAGMYTAHLLNGYPLLVRIAAADISATLLVWAGGIIVKNSSVYDPYWSVAPIVILTAAALSGEILTPASWMILAAVWIWGTRLTVNWAYTFRDLDTQDWRYDKFKSENPKWWFWINLFGINIMPTVIVYLALIPGLLLLEGEYNGNIYTYAAFVICIASVMIQMLSDRQLHRFRSEAAGGQICDEGFWKYSRHPNYFAEIMMWWGVYFMLLSCAPDNWIMGLGAFMNTLLFLFISIPLMEERQKRNKPLYKIYMDKTSMLIPLPEKYSKALKELFSKY